jgi:hypothetical protein
MNGKKMKWSKCAKGTEQQKKGTMKEIDKEKSFPLEFEQIFSSS